MIVLWLLAVMGSLLIALIAYHMGMVGGAVASLLIAIILGLILWP